MANEIARDHIAEYLDYYDRLEKVEEASIPLKFANSSRLSDKEIKAYYESKYKGSDVVLFPRRLAVDFSRHDKDDRLNESSEFREIEPWLSTFKKTQTINQIKSGDKVSVIDLDISFGWSEINFTGFLFAKEIVMIDKLSNGSIRRVVFDDGSTYPKNDNIRPNYKNRPLDLSFFYNNNDAEKAFTYMMMSLPDSWNIHNDFEEEFNEALNEDSVSDLQARLDQIYTPGEKLYNNPDAREIRDLKAKISFAKSQDELKQKGFNNLDQEITGKETFNDTVEQHVARLKPSIDIIKKDCQPYLKAVGGDISKYTLYRGLRGTNTQTMTGRVRLDDRKSAGMDSRVHDKVNDYFVEKFGEPFRNALFTSADPDFAKDYGNLFIIFPIGEFTFIWSESVRDMYDIEHYINDAIDEDMDDFHPGDEPMNYLKRFLDEKEYINQNFKEAISSKNEIMIRCKAYHGINLTEYFNRDDNDDDSKGDASAINKVIQLIQGML